MRHKMLSTAAVLAVAVAVGPANAQTGIPQNGVGGGSSQGTGPGGGSMQREQDQGIKSGQSGEEKRARGEKLPAHGEKGTKNPDTIGSAGREQGGKNATEPSDRTRQGAGEHDRDMSRASRTERNEKRGEKNGKSARDRDEHDSDKSVTEKQGGDQNRISKDNRQGSGKTVTIDRSRQTRVSTVIRSARVQPETRINFALRVGVAVPRTVHFHPVPAEVVEIVPEYRGFLFFLAEDQIVIVDPDTYEIVTVMPYTAASIDSPKHLSSRDRAVIHRETATRAAPARVQRTVTTMRYEVGDVVPADVEAHDLPVAVYTEVPAVRSYRYIRTGDRMVLIDPRELRVADVID